MVATDEIVRRAAMALRAGETDWGRELLGYALLRDASHADAWLWMSAAVADPDEQRYCLSQVLRANPSSEAALRGLLLLGSGSQRPPTRIAGIQAPAALTLLRPTSRPTPDDLPARLHIPEPEPEPALPGSVPLRALVLVLLVVITLSAALRLSQLLADPLLAALATW